ATHAGCAAVARNDQGPGIRGPRSVFRDDAEEPGVTLHGDGGGAILRRGDILPVARIHGGTALHGERRFSAGPGDRRVRALDGDGCDGDVTASTPSADRRGGVVLRIRVREDREE